MKARLISIILFTMLIASCVNVNSTKLNSKTYPPLTMEDVSIYMVLEDIPGEFERVAIINVSGNTDMTNQRQLHEAARKEAAKLGANGILLGEIDEPSSGARVAGAFLGTGTTRRGEMVAIYVHH